MNVSQKMQDFILGVCAHVHVRACEVLCMRYFYHEIQYMPLGNPV